MNTQDLRTPCYIVQQDKLLENLKILASVKEATGCKILLAQKAFSMFALYPLIGDYLDGTAASGLYEARLGKEEMKGEVHIYSPGYREDEIEEILGYCDHIIFNSPSQLSQFKARCLRAHKSIGLRINPECSTQIGHEIYDPCAPGSRLGTKTHLLDQELLEGVEGLHFHTLCEQGADALEKTLMAFEEKCGPYLKNLKWVNFGGGHHITREGYDLERLKRCILAFKEKYDVDVYLEPGEAIALNAGLLVTRVLDVLEEEPACAILDVSAACHMPDVLEMPYRPPLKNSGLPGEKAWTCRLGGPTCLAGDIIGDYSFDQPLQSGDILVFEDMAIYTMVKTNTFNGMRLPDILLEENKELRMIKQFDYDDFKNRLS